MRKSQKLLPVLGLLFAVSSLSLGLILAALPWTPQMQEALLAFMRSERVLVSISGLALFLVGIILLSTFMADYRRTYFHIWMGNHQISVDETLIQRYVDLYWQEQFPQGRSACEVAIHGNCLSIQASLPCRDDLPEQKLRQIESDLSELLKAQIGYEGEYHIAFSFEDEEALSAHES
jgi:hypothetical protein